MTLILKHFFVATVGIVPHFLGILWGKKIIQRLTVHYDIQVPQLNAWVKVGKNRVRMENEITNSILINEMHLFEL